LREERSSAILTLREADKFGIPRYAVRANVVLLEMILHIHPSGFVKVDASPLHDAHDLLLARIIKTLSRITGFYVA
jgi:hypothetical protein